MTEFIGRKQELSKLRSLQKKKSASFVVIRGRRRIGKSRLIAEFGRNTACYIFAGRPPKPQATRQGQIDDFLAQMSRLFEIPELQASDWGKALWLLSQQCSKGRLVVALDEISWIASEDLSFLGELKNAWDLQLSKNPRLIFIVCGSVSNWIEDNILGHTGFVGRISLDLRLKELSLYDAAQFWGSQRDRLSSMELLKVLSVTGGVPRYLEEIRPELRAEENIRQLCFQESGLLFREYNQLFSDLFCKKAPSYTALLEHVADAPRSHEDLCQLLELSSGGRLTEHLRILIQAGFITQQPTWNLRTARSSRLKTYRLSDNYLRFYLKCIRPNYDKIMAGIFSEAPPSYMPQWNTIMGLQFENLILNNVLLVVKLLGIHALDIVRFGPYFQKKTKRQEGCQIDLMIQATHHTLYVCEIKYSHTHVGMRAAHQAALQQKRLSMPKGWSIRKVLIHSSRISRELNQSQAFDHVINFRELVETDS